MNRRKYGADIKNIKTEYINTEKQCLRIDRDVCSVLEQEKLLSRIYELGLLVNIYVSAHTSHTQN